ncbi:MAG: large subunit ribosomal protein [Acidobacteriota bacterium]|nr:large subunit ribosomal protein [Acidobacteriota bacterium]MDT5261238.1 large subunit ribosomal protein [Acidobacteriota bacterium]
MRHLNAHRKLGRTSEHRMSMLRNLATSLINARDERIVTTVPKAKELRPFVERVITLAKRASTLQGEDTEAAAQSLHLRRQAASFFHAGNRQQAVSAGKRGQPRAPRTAGVAALQRLFGELGKRYAERPGGYTRIIRLGHRDGDNAELAIIELVDNPRERDAVAAESKKAKSASSGKKKTAKPGGKAETSSADSTRKKKEEGGGRRSQKTESTAAEQESK